LTGVKVDPGDPQVTADQFVARLAPIVESSAPPGPAQRERAEFARGRYSWERTAGDLLAVFAALNTPTSAQKTLCAFPPSIVNDHEAESLKRKPSRPEVQTGAAAVVPQPDGRHIARSPSDAY
jgi:hypothetical protein